MLTKNTYFANNHSLTVIEQEWEPQMKVNKARAMNIVKIAMTTSTKIQLLRVSDGKI